MKVRGGQIVRRQTKQRSPETTKEKRMPRLQTIEKTPASSFALPRRSGLRPKTIRGPLHVQCTRTWRSESASPHLTGGPGLASDRVYCPLCGISGYSVHTIERDSVHRQCVSVHQWQGIRSCASQSTNHLSSFAFGMRSLGDRSRVGRTALSYILRLNTGRRRRALYAAR